MSDALVIYPRAMVNVKAILHNKQEIDTPVTPDKLTVSLRPHSQASECDFVVKISALPFDPRQVNGVFITAFMGAMAKVAKDGPNDDYVQRPENIIFAGYADTLDVQRSNDGTRVTIKARDLSSFLRDEKNLNIRERNGQKIDPVPSFSDSVVDALKRLMQWAGISTDQINIVDNSNGQRASQPMTSYTNKKGSHGKIPMKNGSSAWQVVEHLAGMASLLIHIDKGDLVIREPLNAFIPAGMIKSVIDYQFIFGDTPQNAESELLELSIKKKFLRNRKGVRLVAFDPSQNGAARKLVADYPDDAHLPPKRRTKLGPRRQVKHSKAGAAPLPEPDREVIPVGHLGIQNQDKLAEAAKRYYLERSRQEVEGELVTAIWDEKLFKLKNSNRIEIRIKPEMEATLRNINDRSKQVAFLKDRMQIEEKAATALLDAVLSKDTDTYYARTITHEWSPSGAKTKIDFIGMIEVDLSQGA